MILLGVVGISLGGVYFWIDKEIHDPGPLDISKNIVIDKGLGVRAMGRLLETENVITHWWLFSLQARISKAHRRLKAGEYSFSPHMPLVDVLSHLQTDDTVVHTITIAEGLTSREIVDALYSVENLQGDITTLPVEGSLLPETYHYSLGDTRKNLISRMKKSLGAIRKKLWNQKDKENKPFNSWKEVLTLASIVEKETGLAQERPQVASVFVNRLNLGMRLQSDPTVIYSLTEGIEPLGRSLTRQDWKLKHPYNTYVIKGLPPGPIGNPGLKSIEAVLNPATTKFLYFVADGTGGHAFATNLKDHNRNVVKWRKHKKILSRP